MASPVLSGVDGATFAENTVNATPQIIDGDVTLSDADGDWTGGQVIVSGLLAQDVISVQGSGPIYFDSSTGDIRYNGVIIGNGQAGAGTFTITFDADATTAGVEAVIEHLTYANTSDTPTASRQLTIDVIDADGNGLRDHPPALLLDAAHPIAAIPITSPARAALGDIDGDGDLDLLVGAGEGIRYFENVGTTVAPSYLERTGPQNPFDDIFVYGAVPVLTDWDNDGDLDLAVGSQGAMYLFYENQGTDLAPTYVNYGLGFAYAGATVPALGDLNGDGRTDMIIGLDTGVIDVYLDLSGSGGMNLQRMGSLLISVPGYAAPALFDANSDGDLDIVVGSASGALYYFENIGTASSPNWVARTGAANPFDGIVVGPNSVPTGDDIDGDGDLDLVVGDANGGLTVFRYGQPQPPTFTINVTAQAEAIVGDSSSQTLAGTADGELMQGMDGDDFLDAGAGDDTLQGGAGADYLRGGAGADAMFGGDGDDFYVVDNVGDTASEIGGSGVDLVHTTVSWTLGDDIENLTLAAPGREINGTGNGLNNTITGNDFANTISGDFGDDILFGKGGADIIDGGYGEDFLDGGLQNDTLNGGGNDDMLNGGGGNDVLDGGYGDDQMAGGAGHDTYYVDSVFDQAFENAEPGTDIVFASANWTLGANFENLTLIGPNSVNGFGNALHNVITGNDQYNAIQGAAGNDTIDGAGWDDQLFGDEGNDIILGGDGNDQMWGGAGSDRLTGGAGQDDFYFMVDDFRLSTLGLAAEKDTITDFVKGEDEIYLTWIDANPYTAQDDDFVLVSKFTKVAGQLVLKYASASDTTTAEMDLDGDGKADFRITVNGDQTDHVGWHF